MIKITCIHCSHEFQKPNIDPEWLCTMCGLRQKKKDPPQERKSGPTFTRSGSTEVDGNWMGGAIDQKIKLGNLEAAVISLFDCSPCWGRDFPKNEHIFHSVDPGFDGYPFVEIKLIYSEPGIPDDYAILRLNAGFLYYGNSEQIVKEIVSFREKAFADFKKARDEYKKSGSESDNGWISTKTYKTYAAARKYGTDRSAAPVRLSAFRSSEDRSYKPVMLSGFKPVAGKK